MNYKVIVGNVGKVYDGGNEFDACVAFDEWVATSKAGKGSRAAGEQVTLFLGDGLILREYDGEYLNKKFLG